MSSVIRRNPLLWILLCALALRAATAGLVHHRLETVWDRDFVIAGDAAGYWKLAEKLAAGDEFSIYSPPRRVHRMPGFPAVLALSIRLFGPNLWPARLLLAAVGTLACAMAYVLGRELFDETIGLIAAAMTAAAPVMVGFSVLILSEILFALCLLGSLYPLVRLLKMEDVPAHRLRAIGYSLAAGVMIAAACYVRPSWLLAAPFFAMALFLRADNKRQGLVRGLCLFLALFAALLPWAWRNHTLTGHWVFTTLWAGPSLYDGLNPRATGGSDMRFFDEERLDRRLTEYEVDRHYRQRAWQFVKQHPLRTLELAVLKAVRFWKPWPNAAQFDHPVYRFGVALFFVPLLVLAVRGWWVYRREVWTWLPAVGPVLYFFALHLVFVASLRYRLPAEYPLSVLSAAGLHSWLSGWRRPSSQNVNTPA